MNIDIFMKKFQLIALLIVVIVFIGCLYTIHFKPLYPDSIDKISIDDVKIKFVSCRMFILTKDHSKFRLSLKIINEKEKKIVIKNQVNVIGKNCITEENILYEDNIFDKVISKTETIILRCSLVHKKPINIKTMNIFKTDSLKVSLPSFNVDGKEYKLKSIYFVNK